MMKIKKILSHNIVMSLDFHGHECVLAGKGIAFGKKVGDYINEKNVEKIFRTKEKGVAEKFSDIIESIPLEYIRVGDEIINTAKKEFGDMLSEKIYLTLIDHIYFAIERHNEGIDLTNSLTWEMQQFYPREFSMGLKALDIIDKRLSVRLPYDEAAFIAFHLVNAGSPGSKIVPVQDSLMIVKDILEIVKSELGTDIDRTTHAYNRFLTHLKFLSMRILKIESKIKINEDGGKLFSQLGHEYPKENHCVEVIVNYIDSNYSHKMTDEEKAYLIIHIHSLISR